MSKDFLTPWIQENQLEWIEFIAVDYAGLFRGKRVSAQTLLSGKGTQKLPFDLVTQTITGNYAKVHAPNGDKLNTQDEDCTLIPDYSTACLIPWAKEPTGSIICDPHYADGPPLETAPRQILKSVLSQYQSKQWQPIVATELEFYLLKPPEQPYAQLEVATFPESGKSSMAQPYSIECISGMDAFFADVNRYALSQNLCTQTIIKEVGVSQFELNLNHNDALTVADETAKFKRIIREVARKHGAIASFMAKPMANDAGSSMHVHQSIVDTQSKQNIFSDKDGNPTDTFLHFIGGLQHNLAEASSIFLPFTNSYRRIAPFNCAPLNFEWGYDNRTVGLRIPVADTKATYNPAQRIENRLAGSDCNPYLMLATSLGLGLNGIEKQLEPRPAFTGSAYELPMQMPSNLSDALQALKKSTVISEMLGAPFIEFYAAIKQNELDHANRVITPWEIEHLAELI